MFGEPPVALRLRIATIPTKNDVLMFHCGYPSFDIRLSKQRAGPIRAALRQAGTIVSIEGCAMSLCDAHHGCDRK
jgi:hypothetical protein